MRNNITKIFIIGAGQIGSRHLQALRAVKFPLDIAVIDPSFTALEMAKQRYYEMPEGPCEHTLNFSTEIPSLNPDIAIIATNSNVRRKATEDLLSKNKIKHIIFEKLLFQKKSDYIEIKKILRKHRISAWVNCPMRLMPFYGKIKQYFGDQKIYYHAEGGNFGLITNTIHYLDHIAYLTDRNAYKIFTDLLDKKPMVSKRKGFLEFTGTLRVQFSNGSLGIFTCHPSPSPIVTSISNREVRIISKEPNGPAWISTAKNNWQWEEAPAKMPYQSQMTTGLVESILETGSCGLSSYKDSMLIHIPFLEATLKHLNKYSDKKFDYYPFT